MIEVGVEYGTATATNLTLENVTIDAKDRIFAASVFALKANLY